MKYDKLLKKQIMTDFIFNNRINRLPRRFRKSMIYINQSGLFFNTCYIDYFLKVG